MYEYQYETVETGCGKIFGDVTEYREIIAHYAANGWRYAGYMPVKMSGYGLIQKVDLIFEKEREN